MLTSRKIHFGPVHFWRWLVSLFFVGLLVSGVLHYEIFLWLRAKSEPKDYSIDSLRLDEKRLKTISTFILTREQNFKALTQSKAAIADPAVP